jgi:hypothetical protein
LGPVAAKFNPSRRADEFARSLVRDFDDYVRDPAEFHTARFALAREIESALESPLLMVETKPTDGTRLVPGPNTVEVFGVVEKGATVKVNNRAVPVADDGSFSCTPWLGSTKATITVEATREGKKTTARNFRLRTQ